MAYEMRIEDEDTSRKEATFKVSSKQVGKNKKTKEKPMVMVMKNLKMQKK